MDGPAGESRPRIPPHGPADHGQLSSDRRGETESLSAVRCGAGRRAMRSRGCTGPGIFVHPAPGARTTICFARHLAGLACVMIVLHHASFPLMPDLRMGSGIAASIKHLVLRTMWHMNIGVPLFFVISGYCIAASVDASRRRGKGSLAFLGRRFWRIYPPYWAAILCFIAVTSSLDAAGLGRLHEDSHPPVVRLSSMDELDAAQWLGNISLTEGWRPLVWSNSRSLNFIPVTWSLGYEEQFYFVCFLVLLAFPKRLFAALAALTAVAVLLRISAPALGLISRIEGTFRIFGMSSQSGWRSTGDSICAGRGPAAGPSKQLCSSSPCMDCWVALHPRLSRSPRRLQRCLVSC